MGLWNMLQCEPSLDDLLADEMMGVVMRSAGTDRAGLRALMREVARCLPPERLDAIRPRCVSPPARFCRPSAASARP